LCIFLILALYCDPTYLDQKNNQSFYKGAFSMFRRCLFNRDGFEYLFEFGEKFWSTYKDE